MSKFKIGDKVVERETGDIGIITREISGYGAEAWYAKWEGNEYGEMWCFASGLDLYEEQTTLTKEEITEVHDVIEYNGYLYKLIGKKF